MASYGIVERIDLDAGVWESAFCRIEDGAPLTLMLFSVAYPDGKTLMVLAESEDRAKKQATCESGVSYDEQAAIEKTLVATRVEFKIQGWGPDRF